MQEKTLTVGQLIDLLHRFDPNLPVEMSMNMEYQCRVSEDMIEVQDFDGHGPYLCITDCPGYDD